MFNWKLTNVEFYTVADEKIECNVEKLHLKQNWNYSSHISSVQSSLVLALGKLMHQYERNPTKY